MFSPDIVCSDAFLEMPASSRELYFQLGMRADDDGFVNPRMTMRIAGAVEDDLKILVAKKFAIPFETGIIVIKHWRMNNFIRKDRYRGTSYLRERNSLFVRPNQSYSLKPEDATPLRLSTWKKDEDIQHISSGQPMVNRRSTQVRLGKDRNNADFVPQSASFTGKDARSEGDVTLSDVDEWGMPIQRRGDKTPAPQGNTLAFVLLKAFVALGKERTGSTPLPGVVGLKRISYALNTANLSPTQVKALFEEWFDQRKPDEELISITRALSNRAIEQFKVRNSIV